MMNTIFTQLVTKSLTGKMCLRILTMLPFLLESYEKLSPTKYGYLKKNITISRLEVESLKNIVKKVFEILVHINFMLVNIIFIIIICWILNWVIRKVVGILGYYSSCDNERRKGLLNDMICMYVYIGVIIYDVALLSNLILNYDTLLKIIDTTSVFWVSKAVFVSLVISIVIILIIPIGRKVEV